MKNKKWFIAVYLLGLISLVATLSGSRVIWAVNPQKTGGIETNRVIIQSPYLNSVNNPDLTITINSIDPNIFLKNYLISEAKRNGIDTQKALFIVEKESNFHSDAVGDSGKSYGLWQFNIAANKNITKKCALDIQCSTKLAMKWLKAGKENHWSVFKNCEQWYHECPY
jgi:hypothetical protein